MKNIRLACLFLVMLACAACSHLPKPEPVRTPLPVVNRGWSYIEPEKELLNTESGVDFVSFSGPVLADERIVFGSERFGLTVLAKGNGRMFWHKLLDAGVMAQPLVADGKIYIGSEAGSFYSFDLTGGHELWHISLGMPVQGTPILAYQRLFVSTQDEALHALDPATGKVMWTYRRPAFSGTSVHGGGNPSAIGGEVWLGFSDGTLVSLNPDTGAVSSERQYRDNLKFTDIDARVVGWHEGLLVSTYDGHLRFLRKDGSVNWEFKSGGARAPLLSDGDLIYFPSSDGAVYAISGSSGKEIWNFALRRGVPTGLALLTWHQRKLIVMAGSEEKIVVLDAITGAQLGQANLGHGSGSYSAIAVDDKNGIFFVLSDSSRVHQFRINL